MDLLERERENAMAAELVAAIRFGRGRMLLVQGAAGVGKTAMLAQVAATAGSAGVEVLRSRGDELEANTAYGVVRQLLERRVRSADAAERRELLAGPAAVAVAVLLPGSADGITEVEDLGAAEKHALYWVCAGLAARRPLLLVVDDAHWADDASLAFLRYLTHRLDELPVGIIAATRPHPDPALTTLGGRPGVEVVALAPLSAVATAKQVRAALPRAEHTFCLACHEATGGNPFLLRELLHLLAELALPPTAEHAGQIAELTPVGVTRAYMERLKRMSGGAAGVAEAAAVLGPAAELRHLAQLARLSVEETASAVDALVAADIFAAGQPVDFAHPLLRTAAGAAIPGARLASLHGHVARLLRAEGVPADRLAPHLLRALPAGDSWAADTLHHAAREALAHGSPGAAATYLHRALREPPRPAAHAAVCYDLGVSAQRLGDPDALTHFERAADSSADAADWIRAQRAVVLALLHAGRIRDAEETLGPLLAQARRQHPKLAVRLEAEVLSAARLQGSSPRWVSSRLAALRSHGLDSEADPLLLANLAVDATLTGRPAAEAVELAQRALAHGRLLAEQTADAMNYYQAIWVLIGAGLTGPASAHLDAALRDAQHRGSVHGIILAATFRSHLALRSGDLDDARAEAEHALDLVDRLDAHFAVPAILAALIDALGEQDAVASADTALKARGMAGELPDTVPSRILLASRGQLRLLAGDAAAALTDLNQLRRRETAQRLFWPDAVPWPASLAMAQYGCGQTDEAASLAKTEVSAAQASGSPRRLGLALRALGLTTGNQDHLFRAVEVLAASTAGIDYARALVDLGAALRRQGKRSDARLMLERGLDAAQGCGAKHLTRQARTELIALGARPRRGAARTGLDALTSSERRVAELAARGLSNRNIAQTLFITMRTVETHLTHTYRKLNIQSRQQLRAALRGPRSRP